MQTTDIFTNFGSHVPIRGLTLYRAKTRSVRPGNQPARVLSWVNLNELLDAQVVVAEAQGDVNGSDPQPMPPLQGGLSLKIKLIICADATPMWKMAATRCDVFLDTRSSLGASGKPRNWGTWWILDGGDDCTSLRGADIVGGFNAQQVQVEQEFHTRGVQG